MITFHGKITLIVQWHNVNNKSGGSIPLSVAIKRKFDPVGNLKTFHRSSVENLKEVQPVKFNMGYHPAGILDDKFRVL